MENLNLEWHKRKIAAAVLLFLLLIGIALIICRQKGFFNQYEEPQVIGNLKEGQLPGTEALKEAEDDQVRIQMNAEPIFADGKSGGNLYIGNPDTNLYDMEVKIALDDTDETVYESGRIPPGYYIENDKLQTVLHAGTYPATSSIVYYDGENIRASYSVNLKITVQN